LHHPRIRVGRHRPQPTFGRRVGRRRRVLLAVESQLLPARPEPRLRLRRLALEQRPVQLCLLPRRRGRLLSRGLQRLQRPPPGRLLRQLIMSTDDWSSLTIWLIGASACISIVVSLSILITIATVVRKRRPN